jgi:hypothetical protein
MPSGTQNRGRRIPDAGNPASGLSCGMPGREALDATNPDTPCGPTAPTESPPSCCDSGRVHPNQFSSNPKPSPRTPLVRLPPASQLPASNAIISSPAVRYRPEKGMGEVRLTFFIAEESELVSHAGMPMLGGVRANSRAFPAVLALAHEQVVPIFQQLSRGHPSGRDDVHAIPVVAAQRRGSVARGRDRHQPRDRPVLVEPVWSNVRGGDS